MFSQIGWLEILVLLVIGLIVIGPERLPGMIKDVRAVILAFRNLVADARKQLDQDLGPEFDQIRKPLRDLDSVRQMGSRGLITKTLFDDDDTFLTNLGKSGQELKDSVKSVTDAASGKSAAEAPTVEVPQQADAGESRQPEAQSTKATNKASNEAANDSEPTAPKRNPWEDVL